MFSDYVLSTDGKSINETAWRKVIYTLTNLSGEEKSKILNKTALKENNNEDKKKDQG